MWIAHSEGVTAPYKLQRLGATNWTLTQVAFQYGPSKDVNPNNTVTIQASANSGAITLTASSSVFQSGHVGTVIYLESENPTIVTPWKASAVYGAGAAVRYEGNIYYSSAGGTSGASPPVHTRGDGSDGGVTWSYQNSGRGWATITGYTSGTLVNATVSGVLPPDITAAGFAGKNNTKRWALAEFSSIEGWPTAVTFFRSRLCYTRGRRVLMSVVGDYDNFARFDGAEVTAETSINVGVDNDRIDSIYWAIGTNDLLVGTSRAEGTVSEQTTQKVFAADNIKYSSQTEYGARKLAPIRIGSSVLFAMRSGRRVREIKYDYQIDKYRADDLTVLADHITKNGIIHWDFAREPDSLLWCVVGDGTLAALTFNRERGVIAWTPHTIGGSTATTDYGVVETVCCIPQPDLKRDDVWLVVQRLVNGTVVRHVEVMEDYERVLTDTAQGWYVDAGLQYSGPATSVIVGLNHLEGQLVSVLADGTPHANVTVLGGVVTLNRAASVVTIGFPFTSTLQTMRPDGGVQDGTGQTRRRQISEVWLRLTNTIGGKVGPSPDRLDPIASLSPSAAIGTSRALFTGDKRIAFPAQTDTDGYVYVVQDQPLPMTVVAIIPRIRVND